MLSPRTYDRKHVCRVNPNWCILLCLIYIYKKTVVFLFNLVIVYYLFSITVVFLFRIVQL